jgi:putative heme-binding domain-containing protein
LVGGPWGAYGQSKVDLQDAQRFVQYCAGCHGADGRGGGKAASLITAQSISLSDAELFEIVHDGTPGGMPPFAQIGVANIWSLVRYLRMLEGAPSPENASAKAPVTGDVDTGRALYFGKAQCSTCHMINGEGGFIAADLTNYGRDRTADALLESVVTPDTPLLPSSRVVTVTTSTGQKWTGVLRNEDNFNLELQTQDGRFHLLARSDLSDVHYTEHSLMPRDYGSRLAPEELNDIVSFLLASSRSPRTNVVPVR